VRTSDRRVEQFVKENELVNDRAGGEVAFHHLQHDREIGMAAELLDEFIGIPAELRHDVVDLVESASLCAS